MEVIERPLGDALLPNLDQARTAGLVVLPGAFVGVLLATGSASQAAAVQVPVLISLMLAQACGVAVTGELVARGMITRVDRTPGARPERRSLFGGLADLRRLAPGRQR